jgi:hemoglobin-like flavoprotein
MTPQQIELVQASFKKVVPIAGTAADLFYDRLFEIAPPVRTLFPSDLTEQKVKLMAMLGTAVSNLHQIDTILPAVKALGERHKGYGVTPDHYAPVGAALLWTLEKGLGPDFTPETKEAWTAVYTALAGAMKS